MKQAFANNLTRRVLASSLARAFSNGTSHRSLAGSSAAVKRAAPLSTAAASQSTRMPFISQQMMQRAFSSATPAAAAAASESASSGNGGNTANTLIASAALASAVASLALTYKLSTGGLPAAGAGDAGKAAVGKDGKISVEDVQDPTQLGRQQEERLINALSNKLTDDAIAKMPLETAVLTTAPNVPPPITRNYPVRLKVDITTKVVPLQLTPKYKYNAWTFGDSVPGPFIRCRVGDYVELNLKNEDMSGMPHNIDFHAVMGPGGGATITNTDSGMERFARFKMMWPGLYVYHCAAAPVPMHVANGMYGLILVEPENGMPGPKPDKEFYVMQSEFYPDLTQLADGNEKVDMDYAAGLREQPEVVVFNGKQGSLTGAAGGMLKANAGDRVRVFFGNGGPNLVSSFHIIGGIVDVWMNGCVMSPPLRGIQTTLVAPGSSCIADWVPIVPGNYTLVDHAIFRLDKGCVGFINVSGEPREDLYYTPKFAAPCVDCKLHP